MKEPDSIEPMFEVPIEPIENALHCRLHPQDLESIDLGLEQCEKLFEVLHSYHQNNRIQPGEPSALRPNLNFVGLPSGLRVEQDYGPYREGSYLPRNGELIVPVDDIKRSLLFADAAVIEDPVFAFPRGAMCKKWQEVVPRYETLRRALVDLATLRPLLEQRLLRITAFLPDAISVDDALIPQDSNGAISGADVALAQYYRDDRAIQMAFGNKLPTGFFDLSPDARRVCLRRLWDELGEDFEWLYRQAEGIVYSLVDHNAFCPYLPNEFQYQIYRKLRDANAKRLDSALRVRHVMDLNSGCAVDPERISVDELVDIRRNEQVFATWRETVREALNESRAEVAQNETQFERFQLEMVDRQRTWEATFEQYNKGALKDTLTLAKQVKLGGVSAVLGATAMAFTGFLSALLPFGYSLYKSLDEVARAFERRSAEGAARSFFFAIRDTHRYSE